MYMSINKTDEKIPKFKFSEFFLKTTDKILESYKEAMSELEKISRNPESYIGESFGVCNNRYKIRYITPGDIATFVSYVGKVIVDAPFPVDNVNDMEAMSVAMIQRFVNDNERCIPFEDTNAYGANANFDQRNIDLGKLVIMCANEFYDTSVYSKSDMIERVKALSPDIKLMADMKFDTKVKKLIDAIPKILEDNICGLRYDLKMRRLIHEVITEFMRTVCVVNLITLEQMMAYCLPNKSFNVVKEVIDPNKRMDYDYYDESQVIGTDENGNVILEAVDLTKTKPVFVNLSVGGNNFVSKAIRGITKEEYSHSSIGFDIQLNKLYTFNGGMFHDNVYNWQKPGFQLEALRSSKYEGIRCTVYCVLVPNEVYDKMLKAAQEMETSNAKYDYKAIASKVKSVMDGSNPGRTDNKRRQICSSFVNAIIAIAGEPLNEKEIASPGELGESALTKPNQFFCVYDGPGEEYDPKLAEEKIEDFAARKTSKAYGDKAVNEQAVSESIEEEEEIPGYYTECCLLKTNKLLIKSKIPFNCNMRDIVLQDMRPDFKDTESAIMFIISDERSPITSLLRKYRTIEKVQPNYRILNMFMHLKPKDDIVCGGNSDPYRLPNEIGKMHTDPNWLDKITYGNQFLDGNYRADALGNNKFTPMEDTLNHLYSMYCCEGLKTNEELANHVVEVANVMQGIIYQYRTSDGSRVCNWEMMRDILAVFGEILTRTMLKLYDNNSIIFTISDSMDDSGVPSYLYNESFVESFDVFLEEAGPSITVQGNKTGAAKVGSDLKTLIQNFMKWIQTKFSKTPENFEKLYHDQIEFAISNPNGINEKVGQALGNGFNVTLNNFTEYKVSFPAFEIIEQYLANDLKRYENKPGDITTVKMLEDIAEKMKSVKDIEIGKIMPSIDANSNVTEISKAIINAIFYGTSTPQAAQTKQLDAKTWESIVQNVMGSQKLCGGGVKKLKDGLDAASRWFEQHKEVKQAEANSTAAANTNPKQGEVTTWATAAEQFTSISSKFLNPLIGFISKPFFTDSYKLYEGIIRQYQNKFDESKMNKQTTVIAEKANNGTTAGETTGEPEQ